MGIGNLAGHGNKDLLVNFHARAPGRSLIWKEHINQAPWFKDHVLGLSARLRPGVVEQKMENGKRTFTQHPVETDYPTFHTMVLADLDGDGRPELITGKQLPEEVIDYGGTGLLACRYVTTLGGGQVLGISERIG